MSDQAEDPERRGTEQADEEARRRFQHLTGMSLEAARAWVAFSAGRNSPARPPRS